MTKTAFIFIVIVLTCVACGSAPDSSDNYVVEYHGALRNFMHENDLSAQANLKDYAQTEHLYALGALENLKGEVLILDSKAFISTIQNANVVVDKNFEHKAALLVHTRVLEWQEFSIPNSITSYDDLEEYVAITAQENGIDIEEPFPFLMEGTAQFIDWHVINWKDGDNKHTHQKHITSGAHGTLEQSNVEILGFYSNSHHAIFTHHSTNMHLHFKTTKGDLAGHVDDLTLSSGMILKLPVTY